MIYFIQDTGTGYYKIGYTSLSSPKERLDSCQTGNPNKLVLIGTIDGTLEYEKELHNKYRENNIRNEWFCLTEETVKNIIIEHDGEIAPDIQDEEDKQRIKWKNRIEEVKKRFSISETLLYQAGGVIPLLSDKQIEELSKQINIVNDSIKESTKDYKNITCSAVKVSNKTNVFYNDEEKTYALFNVSPTVNINLSIDKEAEQYINQEVNKRAENVTKILEKALKEEIEIAKKSANHFLSRVLDRSDETIKELEEKVKLLEQEKQEVSNKAAKNALLKALETLQ